MLIQGEIIVEKKEIERLNVLEKKFNADADYREYSSLLRKAIDESDNSKPERSLIGEFNGDKYYLVLPFDNLDIEDSEWKYKHHGFDMEIDKADGSYTCWCQSLCKRDVKFFVDRMIEEAKESIKPGHWLPVEGETGIEAFGHAEVGVTDYKCSECGGLIDISEDYYRFCPYCGKAMDGVEE